MNGSGPILWHRLGDLGLASLWGIFASFRLIDGIERLTHHHPLEGAYHVLLAAVLALEAMLFAVRGPAIARHHGVFPKLVALIAVASVLPLSALKLTWAPGWLLAAMTVGLMGVHLVSLWALMTLRTSFSIIPEARHLVRTGPYALVRHPLYAAYMPMLVFVGLPRISIEAAVLVAAGIAALVARARYEEAVLRVVFPEYADYAAVTPRFVPSPRALHHVLRRRQAEQPGLPEATATEAIPG